MVAPSPFQRLWYVSWSLDDCGIVEGSSDSRPDESLVEDLAKAALKKLQ